MSEAKAALIVANDRYDDPKLRQLVAPAKDAKALSEVLADPAIGGFEVHLAVNLREHELRLELSRFFSSRKRDDMLIVHFSCHGLKDDDGDLYFAATDTDPDHLHASALPAGLVNKFMEQSASRRILLMLDCCYGGAFSRGMRARAGEGVAVKETLDGTGRVVLTASSAMEFAWEGDELRGDPRPSVFTSAVVDGLRTGDADRDGDQRISVHELYDYVREQIQTMTPHQRPLKFGLEDGPLYIARTDRVRPVPLPEELELAMESALSEIREGAVHGLTTLLNGRHAGLAVAARNALVRLTDDDSRRVSAAAEAALAGNSFSPEGSGLPQRRRAARPTDEYEGRASGFAPSGEAGEPVSERPTSRRRKPSARHGARTVITAARRALALASTDAGSSTTSVPSSRAIPIPIPALVWMPIAAALLAAVGSLLPSRLWSQSMAEDDWCCWRPEYEVFTDGSRWDFMLICALTGALLGAAIATVAAASPWRRVRVRIAIPAAIAVGALAALAGVLVDVDNDEPGYVPMYAMIGLTVGLGVSLQARSRATSVACGVVGALSGAANAFIVPVKQYVNIDLGSAPNVTQFTTRSAVAAAVVGLAVTTAFAVTGLLRDTAQRREATRSIASRRVV